MNRILCCLFLFALSIATFAEEEVHYFRGKHVLASYTGCNHEALVDLGTLAIKMNEAAKATGATVINSCSYVFEPQGLALALLLSESHATIHTYPEYDACFIDIFTCGENCVPERFDEMMQEYLQPTHVSSQVINRHEMSEIHHK